MKLCSQCLTRYAWAPTGLCERCIGLNLARRCEFIEFTVRAEEPVREELTACCYDREFGDLAELRYDAKPALAEPFSGV